MYVTLALIMLVRGFIDAMMMRTQQAVALNSHGYLPPGHFDQIFTSHATIMVFFVAMPFLVGLFNVVVPQQIGARQVAFPFMNSVSLWLTASGAALVMISLVIGKFSAAGWSAYPPLLGSAVQSGRRRRLLDLGDPGQRRRLDADRDQFPRHDRQAASARHAADDDAAVHLDGAMYQHLDRVRLPGFDRCRCAAWSRPLSRHALFHQWRRRQRNELCQPVLDLGPSRSLHPDFAGFWRLFRSRGDVLGQAIVRLRVAGLRDCGHHRALVHRLAAPFLHHGRQLRRERLLWQGGPAHRRADSRDDFRLVIHDVSRPGAILRADAVYARLYRNVCHWRHDRLFARG